MEKYRNPDIARIVGECFPSYELLRVPPFSSGLWRDVLVRDRLTLRTAELRLTDMAGGFQLYEAGA